MSIPKHNGRDERPFVLVEKDRGALRIAALDPVAARAGLRLGMALTEARALWPNLEVAEANNEADIQFLRRASDICDMFTPLVAPRERDGLILDVTGCAHLFGGEEAMLGRARRRLAGLGLTTCAAMAGTPDAAWAFARYRRNTIALPGEEEAFARALPITALDQSTEATLALSRAGFRTLADLADRPSHLLTARFGAGLSDALRRVLGHEDIRITPLRPAPEIMAEKHFPEPLGLIESLLGALERLAQDIVEALERRGAGGRAFEASFFRSDGAVRRVMIETAQGTRDPAVLMRLLKLRIDTLADPLDPGFGFDALRLAVHRSERLNAQQSTLEGGIAPAQEAGEIAALVDRLTVRFGRENVRRFVGRDTHDPVRAGGSVPYLSGHATASFPVPEPGQPPARPITLFEHPQLIEVLAEVPDSPPLRFRWRRVLHEVRLAEGPERIAPEWWRSGNNAPATRDYYRVEDAQGHRFWIFREGLYEDSNARPRWFMHGLFA
ncbi:MAG: DNA polymerase Y family protein [Rhizobiales bacterium]|nr:DNA polymerase Y family protein [Hyphomicrobiales bacterium]